MTSKLAAARSAFRRQSLARKTRLLFGGLATIAGLIAVCAWVGLVWLNGKTRDYGATAETALIASQLAGSFAQAQSNAQHYASSGDRSELSQARAELAKTRRVIADLRQRIGVESSGITARLDGLDRAVAGYDELVGALPAAEAGEDRATATARLDRVTMGGSDFFVQARSMNERIDADLKATGEISLTGLSWFIAAITLLGAWAAFAAFGAVRLARTNLSAPIERITQAMRAIVAGDHTLAIPEGDRPDEIGEMARALDVFRERSVEVARLQSAAAEAARAELEVVAEQERLRDQIRAEHAARLAELAGTFEHSVAEVASNVAAASSQLQLTASAMAAAADQSAEQTGQVSTSLGVASSGVTAAAAASDEFYMSINEIAKQAATSADLARTASTSAVEADAAVSSLAHTAAQIGAVVELIAEIADRTNLLALNASIEAARAGDAGRGFGVVAGEVKELAKQTHGATENVSRQIRAMQEATEQSVSVLRGIGRQIGLLEQAAVSIASAVDQQATAGRELAGSIDLAARNTDEIAGHIAEVRTTATATGVAAGEVLTSSQELQRQSGILKVKAEEFLRHVRADQGTTVTPVPTDAELHFPPAFARKAAA